MKKIILFTVACMLMFGIVAAFAACTGSDADSEIGFGTATGIDQSGDTDESTGIAIHDTFTISGDWYPID